MPVLYVVATPIGNLEDISLRALRVLREASVIAAEDTRKTKRLLIRYDIKTPLISYFEHSKPAKINVILDRLDDSDVALVSEAGTPGINDPGYDLITAAVEKGIQIVPVPGPSIAVTALSVSGLPADRFLYIGFLPNKSGDRCKTLKSVAGEPATLVILESPHRIPSSLQDILLVLGDRRIAVCREMTKLHEEIYRGNVSGAATHFQQPRGEFALVIEGSREKEKPELTGDVSERLLLLRKSGVPAKEAIAAVGKKTGISRRELYQKWLSLK